MMYARHRDRIPDRQVAIDGIHDDLKHRRDDAAPPWRPVTSTGLASLKTMVGLIDDSGRLYGPGAFAAPPTSPKAFGAPALAAKSSSSLLSRIPVPSATRPSPKLKLSV